jgi:serine protease Do
VPASVAAYDHATGFGLLRPLAPLELKPIALGASSSVAAHDRLIVAAATGDEPLSVATVVSRREFAGYWEYLIDGAIFTAPPRADFGGAALINVQGELVGIGSLFVMDAMTPGERLPGNMFVPIDLLKPLLGDLIATGKSSARPRPWVGVNTQEVQGNVIVTRVSPEGPADDADIQKGDVIVAISGQPISGQADFYIKLWKTGEAGVDVPLDVLRSGRVEKVTVKSIDRTRYYRPRPTY